VSFLSLLCRTGTDRACRMDHFFILHTRSRRW
jgi:hypothetical protein